MTEQLTQQATAATAQLQLLEAEVMGYRQPSSSTRMLDEAVLLIYPKPSSQKCRKSSPNISGSFAKS